jgi:predicted O-methyltransferase YrrM
MLFYFKYTVINLLLFLKNILLSPFSRLARHRLSAAREILRYPFFGSYFVQLSELLKNDELSLTLAPVKSREHNVTAFELLSICAFVKDFNAKKVFEIGTYDGRTSRAIAMNLPEDGILYTLNLPSETKKVDLETSPVDVNLAAKVESGERFLNKPEAQKINQVWGDSANFDFSHFYGAMDVVFIDGAHSEAYAKNDTEAALKLLKESGGLIIWHDAHLYGVVKFLKSWKSAHQYPVYFIKETTVAVLLVKDGKPADLKSYHHS